MRHPTQLHAGDIAWPKIRVLVFSPEDSFRFLVRQTFRKLNVREVLPTSVPADATPMMAQAPDIALVDMATRPAEAVAFVERVRAADGDIPVLVVGADRDGLKAVLPLGIEGSLPKRVSGHELSHRVSETLKAPQRMPIPAPPAPPPPAPAGMEPGAAKPRIDESAATPIAAKPRIDESAAKPRVDESAATLRGGAWSDDDLAPMPVKPKGGTLDDGDLAGAEAKRKNRANWQDFLEQSGRKKRKGRDVAGLDVSAIVAAHGQWLVSKGGEGKRADFHGMDLGGIDLGGAILANASFREVDLSDAVLAESRLDGADFRRATMEAADLAGANLGVAQMRHADLRLANLQGASLRGADLSGARLSGARLTGADFSGAILMGTDLCGTDLSQAERLSQIQVEKTLCDLDTRLPAGLSRPRK